MYTEQGPETIPYFLHEGIMARTERNHRRTILLLCIVMALLVAFGAVETLLRYRENQAWLDYIAQYDFEDYEYSQDGEGINIIGSMNGVNTNVAESQDQTPSQEEP